MIEQLPSRIEAFADLSRFAYLREYNGKLPRTGNVNNNSPSAVVVAEEIDGDGRVIRSWFVMLQSNRDGCGLSAACPPHRIVSRDVRPGEPAPDYNPNAEAAIIQQISEPELLQIQRARDEMLAERERHVIYAQSYLDAVQRARESQSEAERINQEMIAKGIAYSEELKKRDDEIWELKNEAALNRLQIATLQASYGALENRKSLKERVKVLCRSKLKRVREWRFGRVA
jgi:hypothetical protein